MGLPPSPVAAWAAEVAAALVALLLPAAWLPVAAVMHVLAALVASVGLGGPQPDDRFFSFAVVLTIPLAGIAGLSAIRLAGRLVPPARLYEEAHAVLADLPGPERPPESLDRVFEWLQAQVSVRPLADVIRSGDPNTVRWAIDLLERRGHAAAVGLLREALGAAGHETQIAASAALVRLEERLTGDVEGAEEHVRREPDSAVAWIALGHACQTYRLSGLLPPVLERHWLARAEEGYRRALALEPAATEAAQALVRVLLAQGRHDEAERQVREILASAPSPDADLLLGEILFGSGRWAELRQACRTAVAAGRDHELISWWAGAS
jgi:tetratricopeptide (TPR) repeat protein